MTKVDATFKLSRALDDQGLKSIARLHAVYGFFTIRLLPSGNELFVEYDAARLSSKQVRGTLEEHGLPLT